MEKILSRYSCIYDYNCSYWNENPKLVVKYLKLMQDWFNKCYKTQGIVYLSEVYKALGIPRTDTGNIIGWSKEAEFDDGFVDFGIRDNIIRSFFNGTIDYMILDFNVTNLSFKKIGL